jgi:hypothetical protein
MTDQMTFTTINCFVDRIETRLDAAQRLFNTSGDLIGSQQSVLADTVEYLVLSHNLLQRMTEVGEPFTNPKRKVEISLVHDKHVRERVASTIMFVKGVVNDPFLYVESFTEETKHFQQGAVLNLRKAQYVLKSLITRLITEG